MSVATALIYRFGPVELDTAKGQVLRHGRRVNLPDSHVAILALLVSHAGRVVSRDALIAAGWGNTSVGYNALEQAISRLRRLFGDRHGGIIDTVSSHGYRFTGAIERVAPQSIETALANELAPFRAFVRGEEGIYTLDRHTIHETRIGLQDALRRAPEHAAAHMDLAMACGLQFEASTADLQLDTATLNLGLWHARRGCELAPLSAEAWSTLSFLLYLNGDAEQAAAAARKAVHLDPGDWRHALRMSYATWGRHRQREARRVIALCPGLAQPHWLVATVFIARGVPDATFEELRLGCAAQDAQVPGAALPANGLHLLHALALAARNQLPEAKAALERELSCVNPTQVYGRECEANTLYTIGALALREHDIAGAEAAFARTLDVAPRHVGATAALRREIPPSANALDRALGEAIILTLAGRHAEAAHLYRDALLRTPPGSAGWGLPVEPVLNPLARIDVWAEALAVIRARAI